MSFGMEYIANISNLVRKPEDIRLFVYFRGVLAGSRNGTPRSGRRAPFCVHLAEFT